ncbi:MAG: GDYXXLXY domain-containing protein [Chitinophagales bacterium]|nr:GDYXXLXY domain-containing protein [Chitinophagales bacterium]
MKTFSLIALLIVAVAQLFVPSKMIMDHESILVKGNEFKFKTEPIDPADPFRGKYIRLNFEATEFNVGKEADWESRETVYVILENDEKGFAKIINVAKEIPAVEMQYVKATVSYLSQEDSVNTLWIKYPFDKFYMEESKAPDAETVYREAAIDTNQVAYAVVRVLNGEAVLSDVMIDGKSIKAVVDALNQKQ